MTNDGFALHSPLVWVVLSPQLNAPNVFGSAKVLLVIGFCQPRPPRGFTFIYQQGTYAPVNHHRWMGRLAIDGSGNMAPGYSASISSLHPFIGYVVRRAGDPLGTLPQSENALAVGYGSQTSSTSQWGDYSTMGVDTTDD
jgi:hypothetical protein